MPDEQKDVGAEGTELALTEFPLECRVDINFDASDVVAAVEPLEVVNLIEELDEEVGLWEATLLAYRYFQRQFEVAAKERPDLVAMSEEELESKLSLYAKKEKP